MPRQDQLVASRNEQVLSQDIFKYHSHVGKPLKGGQTDSDGGPGLTNMTQMAAKSQCALVSYVSGMAGNVPDVVHIPFWMGLLVATWRVDEHTDGLKPNALDGHGGAGESMCVCRCMCVFRCVRSCTCACVCVCVAGVTIDKYVAQAPNV